ncbi:MAG: START-like domain-containing protein [Phocaeicola sp.]
MENAKLKLEYMLRGGSGTIVWTLISTPMGLETWFADKVWQEEKTFFFQWSKTEIREAKLLHIRSNSFIRFHWLDDKDPNSFFELRLDYNELTFDYMLTVTECIDPSEHEDQKELWDLSIENLRRTSGL